MFHTYIFFHPWAKSQLIMMYDPSNVLLNLVCQYFFEGFYPYVHQWYWPVTFFFGWLWYQRDVALKNEFKSGPPFAIFRIVWKRYMLILLYIFGRINLWSCLVLDFFLWEIFFFFITYSISLLEIVISILYLALVQPWEIVYSRGLSLSFRLSILLA